MHPLRTGLFRVLVRTANHIKGHPGPLVSGSVVPRQVLGPLVRDTIVNHGNRRRLDSDAHTHAHHRRARKIAEIKDRFSDSMREDKFLATMLKPASLQVFKSAILQSFLIFFQKQF